MEESELIWMNGEFVPWQEAKVHVLTHGLHYGTSTFEGIRAYMTASGTAVFRHREHLERLFESASLFHKDIPFSVDELQAATKELIARNGLDECYIRPLATRGYGLMGLNPLDAPVDVVIAVWPWGSYLGEEGKANGIRAKVSSWRRFGNDALMPHAKSSGQYLNNVLAKMETLHAGYDEAIMLDARGMVSEGSGENIFVVKDGIVIQPPPTASVLDGITRRTVDQLCREEGYEVKTRDIARTELYLADEIFLTGTAAEVVPVREVDDRTVGTGKPGPVTKRAQELYDDAVHGRDPRHTDWLDPVEAPAPSSATEA
jgi:branched-chain amino acid aminotransferase